MDITSFLNRIFYENFKNELSDSGTESDKNSAILDVSFGVHDKSAF